MGSSKLRKAKEACESKSAACGKDLDKKVSELSQVRQDLEKHVADYMIPSEPELHIVTAPKGLVVREGSSKESEKVGNIERGENFHVLERAFNENGELRLRVGPKRWVSEFCAKTGERIVERDTEHR